MSLPMSQRAGRREEQRDEWEETSNVPPKGKCYIHVLPSSVLLKFAQVVRRSFSIRYSRDTHRVLSFDERRERRRDTERSSLLLRSNEDDARDRRGGTPRWRKQHGRGLAGQSGRMELERRSLMRKQRRRGHKIAMKRDEECDSWHS